MIRTLLILLRFVLYSKISIKRKLSLSYRYRFMYKVYIKYITEYFISITVIYYIESSTILFKRLVVFHNKAVDSTFYNRPERNYNKVYLIRKLRLFFQLKAYIYIENGRQLGRMQSHFSFFGVFFQPVLAAFVNLW